MLYYCEFNIIHYTTIKMQIQMYIKYNMHYMLHIFLDMKQSKGRERVYSVFF